MKSFKKLMLLVMVVGGVGLSAEAPVGSSAKASEAPTDISPLGIMVTCPTGKTNVGVGRHNQGCCPTCPAGKVARVEDELDTITHKINYNICICKRNDSRR